MQQTFRVKLGMEDIRPTALVEKGRGLVDKCTGNPHLDLPPSFLPDMATALDALEAANIAVRDNGGRRDTELRNERFREVKGVIRQLGGYVQAQCGGDQEKIVSTGFETRRKPSPIGILEAPADLRAKPGKLPGQVDVRWNAVYGRMLYRVFCCEGDPKDPSNWQELAVTGKNYHTFSDLDSHRPYHFRVLAFGSAGDGRMSDIAMGKAA